MKPTFRVSSKGLLLAILLLIVINLAFLLWFYHPQLEQYGIHLPFLPPAKVESRAVTATQTPGPAAQPVKPTQTMVSIQLPGNGSLDENLHAQGVLLLAMRDGNFIHLFAYHPTYLPLTRLSDHPWDDLDPALSPEGDRLAYTSRQNGYWDLYVLDLKTGQQSRLTDTPEYEGSPTWSPDGQWIAYERYNGISLDIYIQSLTDPEAAPIQLTDDPGIDCSPAWSPQGREIAFVSSRTGDEEIWLARLDHIDDRFVNISHSPLSRDRAPAWSLDGQHLAWAAEEGGDRRLAIWDASQPNLHFRYAGDGDQAAWSPDGSQLFSEIRDPNQTGLAAYSTATGRTSLPYLVLPGEVYGMTWVKGPLPAWLDATLRQPDHSPAPALWKPVITQTVSPANRAALVSLPDVTAPQPLLLDAVDEAFNALRQQVAAETGWDTLSSLENAYLPLTSPSAPTLQEDWLYTGRAFAVNPLLLSAGWMAISREDFSGQTYWHVYLKARYQDGSMGQPLSDMVWDLNARFAGDPQSYEQGGKSGSVPGGYWIDLSELANRYGWERLPSWINWRTFYPSIRFNQFVMSGGLDWHQAMANLYPAEALSTATPMPTYTLPPTETPKYTPRPITPTPTPTLTRVPTYRPTWTPLPDPTFP